MMNLRTQIFLFLFVFGLVPMVAVVALNLPLVQSKLEGAVRDFQIQKLSSEFIDLGQHIATRQEMVQFLAKVPDPERLLDGRYDSPEHASDLAWFLNWVNRMLRRGQDVIEVLFLDDKGNVKLSLVRKNVGFPLTRVKHSPTLLNPIYFKTAMALPLDLSYVGPIRVQESRSGFGTLLTMNMASAITGADDSQVGVVIIKINVAGMPQRFQNTLWVYNDGRYLQTPHMPLKKRSAFIDFPGLQAVFQTVDKGIWHGQNNEQIIWLPLFPTERKGPIWVGRWVDPSEIETFRQELQKRVLVIIALLIFTLILVARWLAYRIESISDDLTNGIARVVSNERVVFNWRGSDEIKQLGTDLTQLAEIHAESQENLAKRARELEQSNRYKSQFLANMSHELRTPLNSIILLSKILGQNDPKNLTPEQMKHAGVIHKAGNDLLILINDILDIAKVEANKTTLVVSRVHPQHFTQALIDLFEPLCAEKGVHISLTLAPDLPAIETDVDKLQQVLRNFLSNAVKFTRQGKIQLTVESVMQNTAQGLCFRVQDTGIGIPKEKHRVIFEAFKQADGSTSRKFGGTGLGLTISQKIAHLLGGHIALESEPGQGAIFSVCLPIDFDPTDVDEGLVTYQDDDTLEEEEDSAPVEQEISMDVFSNQCVLLIDEDVRNLLTLTPLLEKWGFNVLGAGCQQEAQETLESDAKCDLIMIDILAGDAGVEMVKWIREHQQLQHIPIIVLSKTLDADKQNACSALGVQIILSKPVDFVLLKTALLDIYQHVR